jgi:hypothetical protein
VPCFARAASGNVASAPPRRLRTGLRCMLIILGCGPSRFRARVHRVA